MIELEEIAALLRVLGHGVRLRLMSALAEGERSVGELEVITGVEQPGLSQQLGLLRKAALVQTRREAKQVFYRVDEKRVRDIATLVQGFGIAGEETSSAHNAAPRPAASTGVNGAAFARIVS